MQRTAARDPLRRLSNLPVAVRLEQHAQGCELVLDVVRRRTRVGQVYRGGFELLLHLLVVALNDQSKRFSPCHRILGFE
jgi:hypothetical protein